MKRIFPILLMAILVFSCGNDDDGLGGVSVPPRSLVEVAAENDEEIRTFLQTHFYNYEEFETPPMDFDFKIRIDTIAGDNANKTPLIDQVESAIINVSDFEFNLSQDEENIPHTYYYLEVREGIREGMAGPKPSIADSVLVRYEGRLLTDVSFDGSTENPIWFDLARIQAPQQGFRGFTEGMVNFSAGGAVTDNPDGTVTVEDYGIGMMIFPSALGGFNGGQGLIDAYSPLIFLVDLFTINESDHDNDGIPSILEDLDGDGYLYNDNTDSEDEANAGFPLQANFLDADDDGDGTPTRDEIEIDENGNISFPDSDGDGLEDYLDSDS